MTLLGASTAISLPVWASNSTGELALETRGLAWGLALEVVVALWLPSFVRAFMLAVAMGSINTSSGFVLLVSLPPILLVLLPLLVIIVFVIVIVVLGLIVQSALALSEGYGGASGSCS